MRTIDLRTALRQRYPLPEWVLMEEVRDATGAVSSRSADAIAISMWPSRGLAVHGFEIKASRSDWLREVKNPAKAETIALYCDYWWVVAAPGCVKTEEVPDAWGLLEFENGKGRFKEVKKAPKRDSVKPLDRSFVAAMMRRVGEVDASIIHAKIAQAIAEKTKQNGEWLQQEVERRSRKLTEVMGKLDKIKASTGIDLLSWDCSTEDVSDAIRFAVGCAKGVHSRYSGLQDLRRQMSRLCEQIDALGPLVPTEAALANVGQPSSHAPSSGTAAPRLVKKSEPSNG